MRENVYSLVKQASERVPFNIMGSAPTGWIAVERPTKRGVRTVNIHEKTGIVFKPGFFMRQKSAAQRWEGNAISGGYRLDLQSIENSWANWAIQTNGTNSKTVATCLMKVDRCFSQNQLCHALIQSARRNKICELTQ